MYNTVYSNSCSFGAPTSYPVYAEIVANEFNATLVNSGRPGACNRRIIRSTLRDVLELKPDLVLVGLTFLSRTETWRPTLDAQGNDGHFYDLIVQHVKYNWSNGLIDSIVPDIWKSADKEVQDYYREWLNLYDREAETTNLLTDIIMLSGFLESQNITYKLFSNVDVLEGDDLIGYNSPFLSSLRSAVESNNNILDLWNFSFGTSSLEKGYEPIDAAKLGKHGHPGPDAHRAFGEHLISIL